MSKNLVAFSRLVAPALIWAGANGVKSLTTAEQLIAFAVELGMPPVLAGDSDGTCFVVRLDGMPAFPGLHGMSGACVLYISEYYTLTVTPVEGGPAELVTVKQLIKDYALVVVNAGLRRYLSKN